MGFLKLELKISPSPKLFVIYW